MFLLAVSLTLQSCPNIPYSPTSSDDSRHPPSSSHSSTLSRETSSEDSVHPPPLRQSRRNLDVAPSLSNSALDTFQTARRSAISNSRRLAMSSKHEADLLSSPSPLPRPQPTSETSVAVAFAPLRSAAPSITSSIGSQARQQKVEENREARSREEARVPVEEGLGLSRGTVQSEQADIKSERAGAGRQLTAEALAAQDSAIIRRRLKALDHEASVLRNLLNPKRPTPDNGLSAAPSVLQLLPVGTFFEYKSPSPKPWKGSFSHPDRELWIKSACGFLAGIGLAQDEQLTDSTERGTQAHSIVRSLMSSDPPTSGVSPMQSFDAKDSRQPFPTPTDLLNAMRRFWVDDHALDRAIDLFQATRQGSLRAREFGAAVESLASACVGRDFVDKDLCDVFRRGLNVHVREHVKLQVRMRLRQDKPSNFSTLVNMAADRDGMNPPSNNPIPKKASVCRFSPHIIGCR